MSDEPRNHRGFLIALAAVALATIPFPFIGRPVVLWFGLPLWLWWSLGWTTCLALLTAWGVMRLWSDAP